MTDNSVSTSRQIDFSTDENVDELRISFLNYEFDKFKNLFCTAFKDEVQISYESLTHSEDRKVTTTLLIVFCNTSILKGRNLLDQLNEYQMGLQKLYEELRQEKDENKKEVLLHKIEDLISSLQKIMAAFLKFRKRFIWIMNTLTK